MGHSQGGYLSLLLTLLDDRISAIMPLGVGSLSVLTSGLEHESDCVHDVHISKHLPRSHRRYIDGEGDAIGTALEKFSGYHCKSSMSQANCIQSDGSGHYIVGASEYDQESMLMASHVAGHNFFG